MAEAVKVSVIVPVKDGELTIERALRSILAETAADVEVVVVNDGSCDNTLEVVHRVIHSSASWSSRCRIIDSPSNHGLAQAAMMGMKAAKGEYLARCDADDYYAPGGLQCLIDMVADSRCDVVGGAMLSVNLRSGKQRVLSGLAGKSSLNDFAIDTLHFSVANKLIRRELIERHSLYPFEGFDCWEDLGVTARAMAIDGVKAMFTDTPVYCYTVNGSVTSLSRDRKERVMTDRIAVARAVDHWMHEHGMAEIYDEFLCHMKFHAKIKMLRTPGRDLTRWSATFPEINSRIMKLRHVGWPYRVATAILATLMRGRKTNYGSAKAKP